RVAGPASSGASRGAWARRSRTSASMPASRAYRGRSAAANARYASASSGGASSPSPTSTRPSGASAALAAAAENALNQRKFARLAGAIQEKYSRASATRAATSDSPDEGGVQRT